MPTTNPVPSTDPSDLLFNAQALDEAINSTSQTYTDRRGVQRRTLPSLQAEFPQSAANAAAAAGSAANAAAAAQTATTQAGIAQTARTGAEAARDAAQLSAGVYATTAAGLAATTNGQYFNVPASSANDSLILYLNSSGTAVEIKRYPSTASVPPNHITDPYFSVSDEKGNSALLLGPNGLDVVGSLAGDTLNVRDKAASGIPYVHMTPFILSVSDENGNSLMTVDEEGVVTGQQFSLPGGSPIDGGGLNAMFHPSPFAQIDCFATMGQSNAAGQFGVTSPPVSTTQPYNNIMPLVVGGVNTALTPLLADASTGWEWTGLNACNQVSKMILRDSNLPASKLATQLYSFNSAFGGSGIPYAGNDGSSLSFKANVLFGYNEATRLGKSFNVKAVSFSQGEANNTMSADEYLTKELQMYDWMNAYAKATTGQTNDIKLLTWQVNEDTGPRVAQLLAANRHPNIHIAFPQYCLQHIVGNGGHLSPIGMAVSGAYYGLAYKRLIVDNTPWEPLLPRHIEVRGARSVAVAFNRQGLVFDTTSLPVQAGNGFYGSDSSGALTVSSTSISNQGIVTVTFNRDFVGQVTFGYGVAMVGRTDGFIGFGGNLRDCDGLSENTVLSGTTYPLHNWAVLFKEVL